MPAPLSIRTAGAPAELRRLARREQDGRVGARLLALANALDGLPRERAAELAGMSGQTLGDWVHRYNAEGVAGLRDRSRPPLCPGRGPPGRAQGLDPQGSAAGARRLRRLAHRGPVRPRRAPLRRPLRRERDGPADEASRLVPAEGPAGPPRGRPESAGALQKTLPGLIRGAAAQHPEAARVELWFEDEARVGQKGRVTHVWYQRGVRPRGVREHRFASAHLFGAVCPERDVGVALVLPEVSTRAMTLFLAELARVVPAGTHAVLVLDRAGWHVSGDLVVPANLTLVHLPPYSPELNPVERVWLYLRERWLSHRVLA